ncbi:hypothetical protein BJ742DRAFT_93700 [Cladochytrium replicatum]|nr:hypothetical protein BJ742DRAFT_93700 [Cladochytrium replicatum]
MTNIFFFEECSTVARLAFGDKTSNDTSRIKFIGTLARRLMWSALRWHERFSDGREMQRSPSPDFAFTHTKTPPQLISQTASTAFLALVMCSSWEQNCTSLCWQVALCERFFETLLGGKIHELREIFVEVLSDGVPRKPKRLIDNDNVEFDLDHEKEKQEEEEEEEEESDGEDFYHIPPPSHRALALNFLHHFVLKYVGMTFDTYLEKVRERISDSEGFSAEVSMSFMDHGILRRLSRMLYKSQMKLISTWKEIPTFDTKQTRHCLYTTDQKKLWKVLEQVVSVDSLVGVVAQAMKANSTSLKSPSSGQSTTSPLVDEPTESEQSNASEIVYRTNDLGGAFVFNVMDRNVMAVAVARGIIEIDINAAMGHYKRRGTFSEPKKSLDDTSVGMSIDNAGPSDGGIHKRAESFVKRISSEAENAAQNLNRFSRNLSYDSLQRVLKAKRSNGQLSPLKKDLISTADISGGQRLSRNMPGVVCLEAHLTSNYYVAGISTPTQSVVHLYQFNQPRDLMIEYQCNSTARIMRCRFDPFGYRFAAGDIKGDLNIWRFDASASSLNPAITLNVQPGGVCNDLAFLNSGSVLATTGTGSAMNLSIWDTLLPASKCRVKSYSLGETGGNSLVYSPRHQFLIAGGKKGEIHVFDMRQRSELNVIAAHDHSIKAMAVDEKNDCLITGCSSGEVKLWDLRSFASSSSSPWTPGTTDSPTATVGGFVSLAGTPGSSASGFTRTIQTASSGNAGAVGKISSYGILNLQISEPGMLVMSTADGFLRRKKYM